MNEWHLALGALCLVLSVTVGALYSRWHFAATGAHRAVPAAEETVPIAELFRPQDVNDVAWCRAEERHTLHAFNGDGTRTCWTCRCTSLTGAPRV